VPSANPASAARGAYAVQVSSQRSEAEAQSAYHALQGKYGSVLGSHSMFVHKVDLGAKGTYYRAMVGPFTSQAEASQLCSSLKSAGGSCLVQRN
jgi:cell division septation protein DedD